MCKLSHISFFIVWINVVCSSFYFIFCPPLSGTLPFPCYFAKTFSAQYVTTIHYDVDKCLCNFAVFRFKYSLIFTHVSIMMVMVMVMGRTFSFMSVLLSISVWMIIILAKTRNEDNHTMMMLMLIQCDLFVIISWILQASEWHIQFEDKFITTSELIQKRIALLNIFLKDLKTYIRLVHKICSVVHKSANSCL